MLSDLAYHTGVQGWGWGSSRGPDTTRGGSREVGLNESLDRDLLDFKKMNFAQIVLSHFLFSFSKSYFRVKKNGSADFHFPGFSFVDGLVVVGVAVGHDPGDVAEQLHPCVLHRLVPHVLFLQVGPGRTTGLHQMWLGSGN